MRTPGEPLTDHQFEGALLAALPHLNAFAVSLSGCRERAKDLVQETMLKGWQNRASFRADCNIRPWLFTILRNVHVTVWRKSASATTDSLDDTNEAELYCATPATGSAFFEVEEALSQLADEQREVLLLIVAEGLSYEDAASVCGCAVGTVKSRLSRARERLAGLLQIEQSKPVTERAMTGVSLTQAMAVEPGRRSKAKPDQDPQKNGFEKRNVA